MRSFSVEFHTGLTAFFIGSSFLLYLLDLPFHYFPHFPFFFAVLCYERKRDRRLTVLLINLLLFLLLGHELPLLFTLLLFAQLYLLNTLAFEVTSFDLSVVLFFAVFLSSGTIGVDMAIYRAAFLGQFAPTSLFLPMIANLAWMLFLLLFRKRFIDDIFTRSGWL